MMLREAQSRHALWSEKNFVDRNPDHPLLGVIEEVGELCEATATDPSTPPACALVLELMIQLGRLAHINLKKAQKIRKASVSFDRECDTIDRLSDTWDAYQNLAGYRPMFGELDPEEYERSEAKRDDAVGDVLIYLLDFCSRHGIDMEKTLEETLTTVLARDWTKNKLTGVAS